MYLSKKKDFLDAEFIIEPHISEFLSQYNSSGCACIKKIVIVILIKTFSRFIKEEMNHI